VEGSRKRRWSDKNTLMREEREENYENPSCTLDAAKLDAGLMIKDRQPWMKWIEGN
jgi:hypothetical protein